MTFSGEKDYGRIILLMHFKRSRLPPQCRSADELDHMLLTYPIFGGDLLRALDMIERATKGSKGVERRSRVVLESAGKLIRSLSTLLDHKSISAWRDLRELKHQTTLRLIAMAEEVAKWAAMQAGDFSVDTDNICE